MIQNIGRLRTKEYQTMLAQCIHCGLCLQACPTYAVFGTEMEGPRGRVALMRAASEGKVSPEVFKDHFSRHIRLCLACRSCETACPSGVKYGALIEVARVVVEDNRKPGWAERFLIWAGTQQLMTKPALLRFVARLMWIYESIGLQRLVRAINILPKPLKTMEAILPPVTPKFSPVGQTLPAEGEKFGKVLFFTGCIQEGFLAPVNQATIRVLQRNGYEVFIPDGQTCCGAAQLHLGDDEGAKKLARKNVDTFISQNGSCQAIISNAGGCGAELKEYHHLLAGDPEYAENARHFSSLVKDVNEFVLDNLNIPPRGEVNARVTYSDSCHLRHVQKVVKQPRQLLRQIPGLTYVELGMPDRCCGSAGVYNIAQVDTSNEILDAKMADIAETGAEVIVTSNTGCHMQLLAGVRRAGLDAKVMHVMEVLDMSYRNEVN